MAIEVSDWAAWTSNASVMSLDTQPLTRLTGLLLAGLWNYVSKVRRRFLAPRVADPAVN